MKVFLTEKGIYPAALEAGNSVLNKIKEYSEFDWEWYSEVMKDGICTTDFSKDDWEEQLEKEMFEKMGKYCAFRGYP